MKIINRFTVAALLISTATSLSAQLSLSDRMYMRMERSGTANSRSAEDSETTLVFIKLAQGATRSDLEAEGVNVSTVRGDIALAAVATTDLDRVASLPCVERLEVSRRVRHTMDCARAASGVDKMQQGYQLDQPYTGKGVIAAVVDEGLDANHANFRNEDGTSRIAFLSQIWIDSKAQGGWDGMTYDRDNISASPQTARIPSMPPTLSAFSAVLTKVKSTRPSKTTTIPLRQSRKSTTPTMA